MNVQVMVGNSVGEVGMVIDTSSIKRGDIVRFLTDKLEIVYTNFSSSYIY